MKFIKLSLITALAINSVFAGGDIAPVKTTVEKPVEVVSNTTISGKLTGYYITDDSSNIDDIFSKETSQLGLGATLNVTHQVTDWMKLNFSTIGYMNSIKRPNLQYMEQNKNGAFFNVANITLNYADTTVIIGRQLLNTPMLSGFDWLLAPGSFEAYTVVNNSIENITLVSSYIRTWRQNNTGDNFINLTDINDGNNWTIGASYNDKTINGNIWYYNVDASNYTQVYADGGYELNIGKIEAQFINTNYDIGADSTAYGAKISTSIAGIELYCAYNTIQDRATGFVGVDSLYTSSWNIFTSSQWNGKDLDAFKVGASSKFADVNAELSYADYDKGNETDLILAYNLLDNIDTGLIYTNTKQNQANSKDINAIEIYANYNF